MSGRFDYVKYDVDAAQKQERFKDLFQDIEQMADATLPEGRAKSLVMTYLEIAYMWTGKAIRDDQVARNSQPAHVPERSNQ